MDERRIFIAGATLAAVGLASLALTVLQSEDSDASAPAGSTSPSIVEATTSTTAAAAATTDAPTTPDTQASPPPPPPSTTAAPRPELTISSVEFVQAQAQDQAGGEWVLNILWSGTACLSSGDVTLADGSRVPIDPSQSTSTDCTTPQVTSVRGIIGGRAPGDRIRATVMLRSIDQAIATAEIDWTYPEDPDVCGTTVVVVTSDLLGPRADLLVNLNAGCEARVDRSVFPDATVVLLFPLSAQSDLCEVVLGMKRVQLWTLDLAGDGQPVALTEGSGC